MLIWGIHTMGKRTAAVLVVGALVAAACAGSDDATTETTAETAPATAVPTSAPASPTTDAPPPVTDAPDTTIVETTTTIDPSEAKTLEQINAYIEQAAAFDQAGADAQFPEGLTFAAGGAPGYSRYVFRENSFGVVPTLVEGPLDDTVRCQDVELPCSYLELKELHESGADIPDELQMDAAELAELVSQLDELSAFAVAHADIDTACAEGFVSDRIQTANMGTHLYKVDWIVDGFDPSKPEILLYALADDTVPDGPVGQCRDGVWDGEPMQLIGTSFIIPPQVIGNEHPETFAGPLDNWHIHYNLCRGAAEGRDSFLPKSECDAAGGNFSASLGWMIHAWVDPAHDNDLGVFSMWNSTVAPISDPTAIRETRQVRGSDFPDGAEQSLISDFAYSGELELTVGQSLFFNNVDAVPHTVSAGTFEDPQLDSFDSGLLSPGTNFELTFDEPGVYSLFCTLHPDMVATVSVDG
ncbi:putative blue copper protein [Ilumatobacter coccineus YM16-304]|uniref:Putative blue copper protein n=2 Tax=Ilumatobacter coccineus TaxID=467094 RepID=A0A6C7E461_ILUCY|nr:putative blue copper protein [Ilumatobacter coccineus YM16-304]